MQEGVRKTITEFELKATDADTEVSMFTEVDCAFNYAVVILYLFFIKLKKTRENLKILIILMNPC